MVVLFPFQDEKKRKKLVVFDYIINKCNPYCPNLCKQKTDLDHSEKEPILFQPKVIQVTEADIKSSESIIAFWLTLMMVMCMSICQVR